MCDGIAQLLNQGQPQQASPQPQQPQPTPGMLGTGMAHNAAHDLQNRQSTIDQAIADAVRGAQPRR